MYTNPDCHGFYINNETGMVFCMSTLESAFQRDGGDMHDSTPVAVLPYKKERGVIDERSKEIVARHAREIIAFANKVKPEISALCKVILRRKSEIKNELNKKAAKSNRRRIAV